MQHRQKIELEIATAIIRSALSLDYVVSIHDGEDFAIQHSNNLNDLVQNLASTDEDTLYIYTNEAKPIGWVFLVYGNDGHDVIADHSWSLTKTNILDEANKLADYYEANPPSLPSLSSTLSKTKPWSPSK